MVNFKNISWYQNRYKVQEMRQWVLMEREACAQNSHTVAKWFRHLTVDQRCSFKTHLLLHR